MAPHAGTYDFTSTSSHAPPHYHTTAGLNKYRQGLKYTPEGGDAKSVVRLTGRLKTLKDYKVTDGLTLELKDMGPQFSYRGVFIIEYLGPILILLAYAMRPEFLYGKAASITPWHDVATLAFWCWVAHFTKRELETFFVHKFSRPTMPLLNLFKNSMYYWGFALAVGYPLCSPAYTPPTSALQVQIGLAIFVISELLNFTVHMQLRAMRPKEGSDKREPPRGGLFNLASCPNYTFEVLGWVGFSIMTNIAIGAWFALSDCPMARRRHTLLSRTHSPHARARTSSSLLLLLPLSAWLFTAVGFAQMTQWAFGKHRGYTKQDPKLKKRAAIVPFVL